MKNARIDIRVSPAVKQALEEYARSRSNALTPITVTGIVLEALASKLPLSVFERASELERRNNERSRHE